MRDDQVDHLHRGIGIRLGSMLGIRRETMPKFSFGLLHCPNDRILCRGVGDPGHQDRASRVPEELAVKSRHVGVPPEGILA